MFLTHIYLQDIIVLKVQSKIEDIELFDRVMDINLKLSSENDKEYFNYKIIMITKHINI